MLRTVDLEIVGRTTAHQQDRRNHQEIANRKACIFFRFGFRLGKGQQVFFRDSVQEIHILLGSLAVDNQVERILVFGGGVVIVKNSLPSSSVALSTTVPPHPG